MSRAATHHGIDQIPVIGQQSPSRGQADVGLGVNVPEEGDGAQNVFLRQLGQVLQGGAGNGHQGVEGDGVNAQLCQAHGHVQPVLPGLPHADDPAGAGAHALRLHQL